MVLQYVTLSQARKLKTLGFKEKCEYVYDSNDNVYHNSEFGVWEHESPPILCPSIALVLQWFREVKGIFSCVIEDTFLISNEGEVKFYVLRIGYHTSYDKKYESYYDAERQLVDELIEQLNVK